MNRATAAQHSKRVNQALQLLQQEVPLLEAVRQLAEAHGICPRQAHRYVRLARETPVPLSIPEAKSVFTVKLPHSLIERVRQCARGHDGGISVWVAEALRRALPGESKD